VAREVVKEYEDGQNLSATVQDAKAKLALLQNETSFNRAVTLSLEEIWSVDKDLNEAESTLTTGRLIELATNIKRLSIRTGRLPDSNAKDINNARATRIHGAVAEGLSDTVNSMVEFQKVDKLQQVTVNHGNHGWYSTCKI
jgi:hypothetical protein